MRLKRLGVITVVMAMVLSLAGLASADEVAEPTEATATTIEPVSPYQFTLDAGDLIGLVEFVFYWAMPPDPVVPVGCPDPLADELATTVEAIDPPLFCRELKRPNHGQFVSTFMHWFKSAEGAEALDGYEGKKSDLMKQVAHDDFGKGQWKKDHGITPTADTTEALEAADTDGDGPNCDKVPAKNKHCP